MSSNGLEGIYEGDDHIVRFMFFYKFCGHSILGQSAYSALVKVDVVTLPIFIESGR